MYYNNRNIRIYYKLKQNMFLKIEILINYNVVISLNIIKTKI